MAKAQTAQARVLTDHIGLGVKCNQIVEGPEKVIKALSDAGAVDANPEAVAYAKDRGADVVALADPDTAAELAAAAIETKATDVADASASTDGSQSAAS
jgi:N-acetyl-gamma-glutamylphosphate reductase